MAQQEDACRGHGARESGGERERLEAEKTAAETAKLNAQAELALARQNKAADEKAAFDRGVEVGYGKRPRNTPAQ